MSRKRTIPFEITGIDSLGQGVSKLGGKVTFIPKTAPGDKGEAEIMSEKKGVTFARIENLGENSQLRIEPECIHYGSCPSCHFLHMSYENELKFKKESFKHLFRKLELPEPELIPAPERFHYRNRIQLHYSLKSKLLGLRNPQSSEIIPVPQCMIAVPEVQKELARLYHNQTWSKEAPSAPTEGHVEIYFKDNKVKVSWNRPYAEGGFTQVYALMNEKLQEILFRNWKLEGDKALLDLFGGNGNLSNNLPYSKRLCVDYYPQVQGDEFYNQNLYDRKALENVTKELGRRNLKPENLLLDPPRSGLKDLSAWVDKLKPRTIAYVSCDPHTMVRDLMSVKGYSFKKAFLIDFFPSTFHFESFIILERKC